MSAERAIAVGTFDGVHAGHQRVLAALVASGLPASVVTYDSHPLAGTPLIQSLRRRLELLADAGVPEVQVVAPGTPLDLRVSTGTYVRAIATALGGHCRTLRRLEVGPFSIDEATTVADAELLAPAAALGRLDPDALARASADSLARAGLA